MKQISGIKSRPLVQFLFLTTTLFIGLRFYYYVQQAGATEPLTLTRPAGVEGFLPIGALLAWKRFILTGVWDFVHPAAMVVFGFVVTLSLFFHKAFCAWICPVGTLSEWLWKMGRRFAFKSVILPLWIDLPLRSCKYLLLGFFLWAASTMSVEAIAFFIESPYYKISDVKMLYFFSRMTPPTAIVLLILIFGSLVINNFWCRYLCPYGALTGLLGAIGPTRIVRDPVHCTDCRKCTSVCPHRITVHLRTTVTSPECSACLDCVENCPVTRALTLQSRLMHWRRPWPARSLALVIVTLFTLVIVGAKLLGYWDSRLPVAEFERLLHLIDTPHLSHPSF
jgi:polyferredoxin